ncbi:hypothetical protein [Streptomyces sp. ICBB 8177]|uniref:hypothetical protein n=1 Tax=Streptomyces sp. ICBB 8177 TaxID=563922 RepID=UPI000D67FB9C|nr:hypothetical protein [Streptomyces sp. ICBB 8177]PWI41142.1 hypothetical protein CK485_27770 [Streptomyces sp. ICBB 8177]
MRINDRDDVNHNEAVRVTALAARIALREARGKSTGRLERRVEQILDRAAQREEEKAAMKQATADAKRFAVADAKTRRAVERATRKYR